MRQKALTVAAALVIGALAGAACDNNSGPSGAPSTRLTAVLSPTNEVPPVSTADQTGSGAVSVTLHLTKDSAGSITGGTADFAVTLTGFPVGTVLTGAHIHQAAAGSNAGVYLSTGLANGEVTLSTGTGGFTKTAVNLTAAQANALAAPGDGFYFNVHTTVTPGGAARGQLALQ